MTRVAPAIVLLLALPLAGCITPPPDDGAPTVPTSPVAGLDGTKPFVFNFTGTDCIETAIVFFLERAALQRSLPEGFKAADATLLVGALPVATGRGAAIVANIICKDSTIGPIAESSVFILVDTPKVNGTREDAIYDFYEPYRYIDGANQTAAFEAAGWDLEAATINATIAGTVGTGTTKTNDTTIVTWTDRVPPTGNAIDGIGRFWKVTPNGLSTFDYKFATQQRLGSVTCTLAPGTPYATVLGVTSCTPQNSAGMLFTTYKLEATLVNLPGATVG